jgi:hypothetical protein
MYLKTYEARSRNYCCSGNENNIKYYEYIRILAIAIRHKYLFCSVLYCLLPPALLYHIFHIIS